LQKGQKEPEIRRTSPPWQREDHDEYSAEVSAASGTSSIRDVGDDPGDELQVVHPLQIFGLFPITVADLGSLFIEEEALQG